MPTESQHLEYKRELTDSLEREVVGFLNHRDGGRILIGVEDDGSVRGLADPDGDQLKIKDRLKQNIQPSCMGLFDVLLEESEGKGWIKLIVAGGSEKPYYLRRQGMSPRGCFLRVGSATEPMSERMIEELFAKRTRDSIGRMRSPRQDLSFTQLKIYYEGVGRPLGAKFAENLELRCEDGAYNLAAYLLADVNNASVKVARYAGTDRVDLIENEEFGNCSVVKAAKQVLNRLEVANRTLTRITARERQEQRLFDPLALREAVINAIVHNDYSRDVPPKFELFDDRIEITSAGGLPQGLSEAEFFTGFSVPRNKELMRIFRDLDMVEYLGSGMPRILNAYPETCFHFSDHFLRMIFPAAEKMTVQTPEKNGAGSVNRVGEKVGTTQETTQEKGKPSVETAKPSVETAKPSVETGRASVETVKTSDAILTLLKENPELTLVQVAEKVNRSVRSVEMAVSKMTNEGRIRRIGSKKSGHWEVLK